MGQTYADFVPAFKAIADETRIKIVDMLSWGEMCASDILEEFNISQSTLSYHMRILTESGLVNAIRSGTWMKYTLNQEKANTVLAFLTHITSDKSALLVKHQ